MAKNKKIMDTTNQNNQESKCCSSDSSCSASSIENVCCEDSASKNNDNNPYWIIGSINTASGQVIKVSTEFSRKERNEHIKARLFNSFRMNYSIEPGLYAVGEPDENSDIFVSANYKLSFDILKRELNDLNAWLLVLNTSGINVWCAAGKGTFGTQELIKRIAEAGIDRLVKHRRIILPQLGAVGVNSGIVKKQTGFEVYFGPVDASDIKLYIKNNYKATEAMRTIKFNMFDRLILTPMELYPVMKKIPFMAIIILFIFGLQPEGIIFNDAITGGVPFLIACLLAIIAGSFFTPLLLPFIPFRSFAIKGWIVGFLIIAVFSMLTGIFDFKYLSLAILLFLLFPLLSSYIALQFTGATTYTGISGVKKELKVGIPVYIAGFVVSFVSVIIYKLVQWSII